MKDFYVCNWLCGCDPLKISAILATFLKHKIIAKIFEILTKRWTLMKLLCVHTFVHKAKIILKLF